MQRSTARLIPAAHILDHVARAAFIVDPRPTEVAFHQKFRWTATALTALHEAAEAFLVELLEEANYLAKYAKRVTLQPNDIRLVRYIRIHAGQTILLRHSHIPVDATEVEAEERRPLVQRREWNDCARPSAEDPRERGHHGYGEPEKHFLKREYEPK